MIITHLDKNYLLWGKLLLLSAAKNAPGEEVYISAANLGWFQMAWLRQFHPTVTVVNHSIKVPKTIEYRRYMQCRITQVLLEVYHAYKDQDKSIIAMNADMLIRKPMDELNEAIQLMHGGELHNDFLLTFDEEHLSTGEILNEVMAFNSGNRSILPFLEHYNSMWDDGKVIYRDDQRQLLNSYYRFSQCLTFFSLPTDYTDKFMQPDSHIWSARRHNRFTNYNAFCRELGLPELDACPEGWGVEGC